MLDIDTFSTVFKEKGYQIERADYIPAAEAKIPEFMWLDGREWCAMIIQKKMI